MVSLGDGEGTALKCEHSQGWAGPHGLEYREYLACISRMQAPGKVTPCMTRGAAQDVPGTHSRCALDRGGGSRLSVSGVSCFWLGKSEGVQSLAMQSVSAPGSKPASAISKLCHVGQVISLLEVQLLHSLDTINTQGAPNVWGTERYTLGYSEAHHHSSSIPGSDPSS